MQEKMVEKVRKRCRTEIRRLKVLQMTEKMATTPQVFPCCPYCKMTNHPQKSVNAECEIQ